MDSNMQPTNTQTDNPNDKPVETKKTTAKKVLSIIGNVLLWAFVAFSVVVTVLAFMANSSADGVPTINNKVISPVRSESMKPVINKGDIIISRKLLTDEEKSSLSEGTIITFKVDLDGDGQPEINTHRIEKVNNENGIVSYKTKGENNLTEDTYEVYPSDVVSVYTDGSDTRIPGLGYVILFLLQPTGFFICIVIPLILFFLFEIVMFVRKVVEVKNADKKQITAEDEELIKRRAVEEYIRSQQNTAVSNNVPPQSDPAPGPAENPVEPDTDAKGE